MRTEFLVVLLLVLGVIWVVPVAAQSEGNLPVFYTGNTLLQLCQSPHLEDEIACSAYIAGVADGSLGLLTALALVNESVGLDRPVELYCYPEHVSKKQIADVVAQYIEHHPETRHEAAPMLVLAALRESFPCQN